MRLFDTTFLIDLVNKDAGAGALANKVDEEQGFAGISVITVHEYLLGVHHRYFSSRELPDRLEAAKKDLAPFEIIPMTGEIAQESSQLQAQMERRGQSLGINDLYIAATAIYLKLSLVTRNTRDFSRIPGLKTETY